jgi:DNA-binding CsgD family transcriptional regulator
LIDLVGCGVILLKRSGKVAHVNEAAKILIERFGLLQITHREIPVSDNPAMAAFLNQTTAAVQNEDFTGLPAPRILECTDGSELMIHSTIFPTGAATRFPENVWSDPVSGALVFTSRYGLAGRRRNFGHILSAFDATPAEAKLGEAVVCGVGLSDYADRKQLSRHTVRNQMQALLRKTDTKNQQDFIRKILTLDSPFT